MQKNGVGIVVYVGDELGPLVLLSVASRLITVPPGLKIFVMPVLLPAMCEPVEEAVNVSINLNRQLVEVVFKVTLPV